MRDLRRLAVPWTFHLGELPQVIRATFGWWDYPLHQFVIGGLHYGDYEQIGVPEFDGDSRGFGGEHAETKQWAGGHSDPEWFDLNTTDRRSGQRSVH